MLPNIYNNEIKYQMMRAVMQVSKTIWKFKKLSYYRGKR